MGAGVRVTRCDRPLERTVGRGCRVRDVAVGRTHQAMASSPGLAACARGPAARWPPAADRSPGWSACSRRAAACSEPAALARGDFLSLAHTDRPLEVTAPHSQPRRVAPLRFTVAGSRRWSARRSQRTDRSGRRLPGRAGGSRGAPVAALDNSCDRVSPWAPIAGRSDGRSPLPMIARAGLSPARGLLRVFDGYRRSLGVAGAGCRAPEARWTPWVDAERASGRRMGLDIHQAVAGEWRRVDRAGDPRRPPHPERNEGPSHAGSDTRLQCPSLRSG